MKLQPDQYDVPAITASGNGWLAIDQERATASVLLSSQGPKFLWNCSRFDDLTREHFARIVELDAEVVVFGSGQRLRFPNPAWLADLINAGVGVESMDTLAACRTYNILAGEGRRVVAALLIESSPPQPGN